MIERIDHKKCTGCGLCVEACPLDTLRIDPDQKEAPPCQSACPARVDIRGYNFYLKNRMPWQAARILADCLPYPALTGRLCQHPCQKACARSKVDGAVNINALERHVGDYILARAAGAVPVIHAARAAVVGSGPAGLAAAYFLARLGYQVAVLEKDRIPGGAFWREVDKGNLPRNILEAQIEHLRQMGVEFRTNCALGPDISLRELRGELYKAVLLASGPGSLTVLGAATGQADPAGIDTATCSTGQAGVFACGGLLLGSSSLVKVIAQAKRAALAMDAWLQQRGDPARNQKPAKAAKPLPGPGITPLERAPLELGPADSLNQEQALAEAELCMSCGAKAQIAHPEDCMTCFKCELACPSQAVFVHPFKEVIPSPIPCGAKEVDGV